MKRIVSAADISADPELIWELMCDPRGYPDFVEATDRMVDLPEEEFAVGYTYREYGGVQPFKGESEWRVAELDPPRRQVHLGDDGMMTIRLTIDTARIPGGTRLTHTLDLWPRWFIAPINAFLWPLMMRKRTQASMDTTTENVKRIAETSLVPQAAATT